MQAKYMSRRQARHVGERKSKLSACHFVRCRHARERKRKLSACHAARRDMRERGKQTKCMSRIQARHAGERKSKLSACHAAGQRHAQGRKNKKSACRPQIGDMHSCAKARFDMSHSGFTGLKGVARIQPHLLNSLWHPYRRRSWPLNVLREWWRADCGHRRK